MPRSKTTPTANREYKYKHRFGISIREYEVLLRKQNGCCLICKNAETTKYGEESVFRLAIDHCHSSGKIRGLLCRRCNQVLGLVRDNVDVLRGMATYVETADTGHRTFASAKIVADDLLEELKNA